MIHANSPGPRKVLLAEFNEVTWRLVEPLCARGKLPTFSEFIREGTRGAPVATEDPPDLDPWISWTTLYTGRPQEEHGVRFLEQPPETVTGPRVWEIAADAGKTVGVFGSIMSWPPRPGVRGFWVPSTFSPGPETSPPELRPIQELNLTATRAHTPLDAGNGRGSSVARVLKLLKLGLRPASILKGVSFLVRSRLRRHRYWEKVSLQPLINLDFFEKLYRSHRPDLATFHTNHVAHYQHRYWRSMDSAAFHVKASPEEVRRYGPAIEYGYRVADTSLRRLWKLADDNTVVILASGLGQQPYVVDAFKEGREIVRVRDIRQIVELCGVAGSCTPLSMMAPQWNLRIPDPAKRAQAARVLRSAWVRDPETRLVAFDTVGDTINFNISQKNVHPLDLQARCVFPDAGGRTFALGELCAVQDATPKEGYHDPVGLTIFRGAGVRRGAQLRDCTNLDFAPTILHLLALPIPSHMKGRVLHEAFEGPASVAVPRSLGSAGETERLHVGGQVDP
ncbi:MAG TPA: alkaline phosphatase family protein [Gemmataceae bacterium]|nr:alkaline phosphatase family protein [Gemmataceae bacterium]